MSYDYCEYIPFFNRENLVGFFRIDGNLFFLYDDYAESREKN